MSEPPAPPPYWAYPPPQLPPKRGLPVGAIIAIVLAILAALGVVAVAALVAIGSRYDTGPVEVTVSQAGCGVRVTKTAPLRGIHVDVGEHVDYPETPPAFGRHWGNFLRGSEIRSFYTVADRPPVERLVHSLEHGYTILWYDVSVTDSTEDLALIRAIAAEEHTKFMAAPWTPDDGPRFRDGAHIALTHWSARPPSGADSIALGADASALGIWEFCERPSREAIEDFIAAYPHTDAPEPSGP